MQSFIFFKNWNTRELNTFSYHFEEVNCPLNFEVCEINGDLKYMYFVIKGEFLIQSLVQEDANKKDPFIEHIHLIPK